MLSKRKEMTSGNLAFAGSYETGESGCGGSIPDHSPQREIPVKFAELLQAAGGFRYVAVNETLGDHSMCGGLGIGGR